MSLLAGFCCPAGWEHSLGMGYSGRAAAWSRQLGAVVALLWLGTASFWSLARCLTRSSGYFLFHTLLQLHFTPNSTSDHPGALQQGTPHLNLHGKNHFGRFGNSPVLLNTLSLLPLKELSTLLTLSPSPRQDHAHCLFSPTKAPPQGDTVPGHSTMGYTHHGPAVTRAEQATSAGTNPHQV